MNDLNIESYEERIKMDIKAYNDKSKYEVDTAIFNIAGNVIINPSCSVEQLKYYRPSTHRS
jgi:hypothetical protein